MRQAPESFTRALVVALAEMDRRNRRERALEVALGKALDELDAPPPPAPVESGTIVPATAEVQEPPPAPVPVVVGEAPEAAQEPPTVWRVPLDPAVPLDAALVARCAEAMAALLPYANSGRGKREGPCVDKLLAEAGARWGDSRALWRAYETAAMHKLGRSAAEPDDLDEQRRKGRERLRRSRAARRLLDDMTADPPHVPASDLLARERAAYLERMEAAS